MNEKQHLTEENFNNFCQSCYFNPECSGKNEYIDDLKRIKYIKRLLQKAHKQKTLKAIRERLILNHLIILRNVFGEENCARILFFNFETRLHSYLKSFLVFLEFNIQDIPEVNYNKINTETRIDKKLSITES
jgi:hypothetical protein|tara:strand:- start:2202 stop:2597 length:396 start_codon:yes stop_codon:yes gene_type:complete